MPRYRMRASASFFAEDPQRAEHFAFEAVGLYFDYSKNRITDETVGLLLELATQCGLRERINAMFHGEKINLTEKRAILHVALRATKDESIMVDGRNVVPEVHAVLDQMTAFANQVRNGQWRGHIGKRIRNVINIGIGGSDLGPVMAYEALKYYSQRHMTFRFVSNVDSTDFAEATRDLNAYQTLFIVSSKTFTTLETMTNAHTAREWALQALGDEKDIARHFVAVSTNTAEVKKFGIDAANKKTAAAGSSFGYILRAGIVPGAVWSDKRVSLFRSPAVALVGQNPAVVLKDRIDHRPGGLNRVLTGK